MEKQKKFKIPNIFDMNRDGRGVDDDAALALDRVGLRDALGRQAEHVERADEIDVDDPLELREREGALLADRLDGVADAGAVHRDPQRAERLGDVERLGDGGLVGDVGADEADAVAEFLGDGLTVRGRQVDDDDLGPVVQQGLDGGETEAGGTTGDDGDAVVDDH